MNESSLQAWLHRALEAAFTIVVVALLLAWAWALLRPLVAVIAIVGVIVLIGRWWISRWRI